MDIVIHATKDGYRTLYATNSDLAYLIAKDMRSGANDDQPLGQSAYSISFIATGTVFTKYTIVKDTQRSNALGTIAYSLFLSFDKVLEGKNIVSLLDELSKNYSDNYIKNNYLNCGEKELVRENWNFVSTILEKYKEQENNQKEGDIQSGSKDAAFIYYNNTVELEEYLDKPFQEEYSDYKQVLFVSEKLKGNLNPLNVLTNSDVELKNIDLKNEYFYLSNYNDSKRITILANGKERSQKKNNNSIRSKSEVEIKYIKDERCYLPIEAKGTLSNPNSAIFKYLKLTGNNISINYEAFNNPPKKSKSIIFEILDYKGNFVDNAEIKIGYRNWQKIIGNHYEYTFEGEELIGRETISVKKGDFLVTKNDFIPEQANKKVALNVEERKTVELDIKDEDSGNQLFDFEVSTKLTNGYRRIKQLEFVDEQIADSYDIKIRKHGFDDKEFNNFQPSNNNILHINLKKKKVFDYMTNQSYNLDFGNHGKKSNSCPDYSNRKNGTDLDETAVLVDKGWKFVSWQINEAQDTLIAQYVKQKSIFKKPIFLVSIFFGIVAISLGVWFIYLSPKDDDSSDNNKFSEIQKYIDGDSIFIEKLDDYKNKWETEKPEGKEIRRGFLDWVMGREKQIDYTEYDSWKNDLKNIESAIVKRNLIIEKNFEELKKQDYSNEQKDFKNAIIQIDSTNYKELIKSLPNFSAKTLSEISISINKQRGLLDSIKNNQKTVSNGSDIKNNEQKTTNEKDITSKVNSSESQSTNQDNEISIKLKGSNILLKELKDINIQNVKFRKSAALYISFLEKAKNNSNQKEDYDILLSNVKKDDILKNSELKNFLNGICSSSESFNEFNRTPGKGSCESIKQLKLKIK